MNIPARLIITPSLWLALGLLVLSRAPAAAQYSNSIVWTTNYYSVTGANFREIRQSIAAARPWKDSFDGDTRWSIDWRFKLAESAGHCTCASYGVTTKIVTTLPRWKPAPGTPQETHEEWARYFLSLSQHEAGHARFAVVAAAAIAKSLSTAAARPDCEELKRSISERASRILDDYRQREKEYDRRTEHGNRPLGPP